MKKTMILAVMAIVMMGLFSCQKDDPKPEKGEVVTSFDDLAWFMTACCEWDSLDNYVGIRIGAPTVGCFGPGMDTYLQAKNMDEAEEKVLDLLPPGKKFENGKISLLNMEGRVQGTLEMMQTEGDNEYGYEANVFAVLQVNDHTGKCPLQSIRFMKEGMYQIVASPYVPGDVVLISWHGKQEVPVYPGYTPPCRETREVVDTLFYERESTYRHWESHVFVDGTWIETDPNKGPLFWVCIKPATDTERGILMHIMPKDEAEESNNGYATVPMAKRIGAVYRTNRSLYTQYIIQVSSLGTRKLGDGSVVLDREEVWTSQYNHGIFFPDFFSYHLDNDNVEKYAWTHPDLCKLRAYEFDINGNLYPDMRNK
ncbi:MAG: hypothetical protein MJZ89_00890 [Paludibacteraceae bacterium]|nr:hypothetical protein [Paludibacteraceae bacterium]